MVTTSRNTQFVQAFVVFHSFLFLKYFYNELLLSEGRKHTDLISEKIVSQDHILRHLTGIIQDKADPTWLLAFIILSVYFIKHPIYVGVPSGFFWHVLLQKVGHR